MTLTLELDRDSVGMNQRAKYLGQSSCSTKAIYCSETETHTNTHLAECSTRTTKVVGKNPAGGTLRLYYISFINSNL